MTGLLRLSLLASLGILACSSESGGNNPAPGPGGGSSGNAPTAGNTPGGSAMQGGTAGTGGVATGGGGVATGGGGSGGTAGGGAPVGGNNGEDPVAHPLNPQATKDIHTHMTGGRPAGVDMRLPKLIPKLIINIDVDNGSLDNFNYAITHGYYVYGGSIYHCKIAESTNDYTTLGRAHNGDCRLETFDGVDRDATAMVNEATSVTGKLKAALADLAATYPEEGWDYFLSADGNVRWSDVGITGYSHGATSAIRWAKKVKLWKAVARSGPRDNVCGTEYMGKACPDSVVSSWLDEESVTPTDRLYGLVGNGDSQYGDILFAMERMKLMGMPTDVTAGPPNNGSRRLFINGGHDNFAGKEFWPVMDYIFETPAENVTYANTH